MPRQLAFDLPAGRAMSRADFLVTPANATAFAALEDWPRWPDRKLLLTGPQGAGKTHLAHIWAAEAGAVIVPGAALAAADPAALAAAGCVVLEDAQQIAGVMPAETALFHLHNLLVASGGYLLITAALPANRWPLALPDLASRMQATATARLDAPDDALLSAVLLKLFADRQIAVSPALIPYLVQRMERSLAAAGTLVAALDRHALAKGRAISRALAAEVLDSALQPKA